MDIRLGLPANAVLDESYRIVRIVGSGGFGITYEAEDIRLDTLVAIKEYYPRDFGDRDATMSVKPKSDRHKKTFDWGHSNFLQEARTLARFEHPSIVRVTRVFEANSTAYMVMRFERGERFEAWLNGLQRLPTQEELDRIVAPLLDALQIMHAANFLHRDIAPDNIIVRADGSPVLLDFGAARRAVAEMSRVLTGIFKAGYSPLEQYANNSRLQGPWSDLFALGGTLYRAVTGNPPVEATRRVDADPMPPAAQVARRYGYRPNFLSAIDACLKVPHSERPRSVAELRSMLLDSKTEPKSKAGRRIEQLRPLSKPAKAPSQPSRTRRTDSSMPARPTRRRWTVIVATMLAVLGGIYGGHEFSRWRLAQETAVEEARERARKVEAEEARKKAEEKRQAEEQARKEAERRLAEERTRREAEEKRQAEERVRKEAEQRRLAEERARREAEEARERARKAEAEEARKKAEEKRQAEEQARKEAERRLAEERARREAEEAGERARKAEAEEARKKAEEKRQAEERAREQRAAEARKKAEDEARRRKVAEVSSGDMLLPGLDGAVTMLAVGERRLATGTEKGTVELWHLSEETAAGRIGSKPLNLGAPVVAIALGPDDKVAASGPHGAVAFWDAQSDQRVQRAATAGQKRILLSLRYNAAASQFMAVFLTPVEGVGNTFQTMLERWSPTGSPVDKPKPIKAVGARFVAAAAFAPNSDLIALATTSPHEVMVVNPGRDAPLFQQTLGNYTRALVFSPNGRRIAAAGDYEQIRVWELADASTFARLVDFDLRRLAVRPGADIERVTALAFSPDGRFLASAHSGDRIAVWDTRSPEKPLAEYEDKIPAGSVKWLALLQPSPGDMILLRPWDDETTRRIAIEPGR